jgi:hypothetical protein
VGIEIGAAPGCNCVLASGRGVVGDIIGVIGPNWERGTGDAGLEGAGSVEEV